MSFNSYVKPRIKDVDNKSFNIHFNVLMCVWFVKGLLMNNLDFSLKAW